MILVFWRGKGYWVTLFIAAAMFLPLILLRQIEGPEVDHSVGVTMGLAAVLVLVLGLRLNRDRPRDAPSPHSLWGLPMQYWAIPMMLFAVLLGTRTITTEEAAPPAHQIGHSLPDGTLALR